MTSPTGGDEPEAGCSGCPMDCDDCATWADNAPEGRNRCCYACVPECTEGNCCCNGAEIAGHLSC